MYEGTLLPLIDMVSPKRLYRLKHIRTNELEILIIVHCSKNCVRIGELFYVSMDDNYTSC